MKNNEFYHKIDDVDYHVEYEFCGYGDDCELDSMIVTVDGKDVTDSISKSIDEMLVCESYKHAQDACSPKDYPEEEDR